MDVPPPPLKVPVRQLPTLADRALVEAVYRAMCMAAAAVRVRFGIVIVVKMSGIDQSPQTGV